MRGARQVLRNNRIEGLGDNEVQRTHHGKTARHTSRRTLGAVLFLLKNAHAPSILSNEEETADLHGESRKYLPSEGEAQKPPQPGEVQIQPLKRKRPVKQGMM